MTTGISPWVADSAEYRPDRYYTYGHLTEMLRNWEQQYPTLISVESIGKTLEGRDIWAATLTNTATGHHSSKPATFLDANIHAGEVTGCSTILWLINHLLTGYGEDETVTHLLDTVTLYTVPAIMLDGMELYLTTPERLRSSVRLYPETEPQDGLRREDLDGDGRILSMRVRDDAGAWKEHPEDPRVMIRRGPDERGGTYYSVFEEGLIRNWDGGKIAVAKEHYGLDLNRNFPRVWGPEWEQQGAGEFPLSEPETRALADFLFAHPNIGTAQHLHTWSGVILRPSVNATDADMNQADLAVYKAIGKMGEEETGYKCISIHDDFAYDKKKSITGSVLDWVYETFGVYAYSTELWSLPAKAGIEITDWIGWGHEHPDSDELAMAKVLDEFAEGEGIFDWKPFEHPQLSSVEIGGWDYKFAFQNPPGPLLEEVTSGNARFVMRKMGVLPQLKLESIKVENIGGQIYKVGAVVVNDGFLPTHLSEVGKRTKTIKPPKLTLTGAEIAVGKDEVEIDHLAGRSALHTPLGTPPRSGNLARGYGEWVVKANAGDEITITAVCSKAGVATGSVTVE
ncbi:MAG: M14 family metallopeptidase [Thermomicrobiales bacterium]|nr:M14 family metallopeptidase [Thermomicrobiales bacterium]